MTAFHGPAQPGADVRFRRRLLDGLAAAIAERGYRSTTVTDIVGHARTSKRTFYREFADKQECFVELMRTTFADDMVVQVQAAIDPEAPWQTQIRQGIGAYIDRIDAASAIALSWIRDLPTVDPVGQAVQRQTLNQMTEMMIDITNSPGFQRAAVPQATRPLAALLVGGIRESVALAFEDGHDAHHSIDTIVTATLALLNDPGTKDRG